VAAELAEQLNTSHAVVSKDGAGRLSAPSVVHQVHALYGDRTAIAAATFASALGA